MDPLGTLIISLGTLIVIDLAARQLGRTATAATPRQDRPPALTAPSPEFHTDVDRTSSSLRSDGQPEAAPKLSTGAALMFPGARCLAYVIRRSRLRALVRMAGRGQLLPSHQRTPDTGAPPQLKNNRIPTTEEQPNTDPTTSTTGAPTGAPVVWRRLGPPACRPADTCNCRQRSIRHQSHEEPAESRCICKVRRHTFRLIEARWTRARSETEIERDGQPADGAPGPGDRPPGSSRLPRRRVHLQGRPDRVAPPRRLLRRIGRRTTARRPTGSSNPTRPGA